MMRCRVPTQFLTWPEVCLAFGDSVGCDKLGVGMRGAPSLGATGRDIQVGER
jgi:hypothetical protein